MKCSIPSLLKLLYKALDGNEDGLEILGVQNGFNYSVLLAFDPDATTKDTMQQEITNLLYFAKAAAQTAILHMLYLYFCLFDRPLKTNNLLNGYLAHGLFKVA